MKVLWRKKKRKYDGYQKMREHLGEQLGIWSQKWYNLKKNPSSVFSYKGTKLVNFFWTSFVFLLRGAVFRRGRKKWFYVASSKVPFPIHSYFAYFKIYFSFWAAQTNDLKGNFLQQISAVSVVPRILKRKVFCLVYLHTA